VLSPRLTGATAPVLARGAARRRLAVPVAVKPGHPLTVCGVQVRFRRAAQLAGVPNATAAFIAEALGLPRTCWRRTCADGHRGLLRPQQSGPPPRGNLLLRRETITGCHGLLEEIDLKALGENSGPEIPPCHSGAALRPHRPASHGAEVLRVGLPDYAAPAPPAPITGGRCGRSWPAAPRNWAATGTNAGRCGKRQFVPHSCRNRHCPTCQGANGHAWMQAHGRGAAAGAVFPSGSSRCRMP